MKIPTLTQLLHKVQSTNTIQADNRTKSEGVLKRMCLMLAGDIHRCPGLNKKTNQPGFPPTCCRKGVTSKSKGILRDHFGRWTHITCNFPNDQYEESVRGGTEESFTCQRCCLSALPGWVDKDSKEPNHGSSAQDN